MIKKIIGLLFIAALMIGVATFWAYSQTKTYVNQPLKLEGSEIITIPSGSGFGRTLAILTEKGWIEEPTHLARLIPKLYPEITRIKAGTYQIQSEMSLYQALEVFNLGKEHQFTITFVEGSRFQEWMVQMAQDPYLVHELAGLPNPIRDVALSSV
ncbi:putative aminodeoxychorismate lyase [Vibrio vulnificus]|nr:putative aminodeoxychorismate lyase [Vibrio vulnificus]